MAGMTPAQARLQGQIFGTDVPSPKFAQLVLIQIGFTQAQLVMGGRGPGFFSECEIFQLRHVISND